MENVISSLAIFGNKCLHNRTMFFIVFWQIQESQNALQFFRNLIFLWLVPGKKADTCFLKNHIWKSPIILCKIWGQLTNNKLHLQILLWNYCCYITSFINHIFSGFQLVQVQSCNLECWLMWSQISNCGWIVSLNAF